MKTQGKREIVEAVLIAALSTLVSCIVGAGFEAWNERAKAKRKKADEEDDDDKSE